MQNFWHGKVRPDNFVFLPHQDSWVTAVKKGRQSFAELLTLLPCDRLVRNHLVTVLVLAGWTKKPFGHYAVLKLFPLRSLSQARHQRVRFAWNSRAPEFELRVISWGCFSSDEHSAPVKEKQTEAIDYQSLYCTSTVQFLVLYKYSKKWKMSSNCPKYLLVKLDQKPKITTHV